MKLCIDLMTVLFQQRGIAVAYASMACPVPDNITKEELQFYNYQANSEWKLSTFSLRGYSVDITASNNILRTLSQQHNAFYIPVAEQISEGWGIGIFRDFCHMAQPGIEIKADVIYEFVSKVLENYYQGAYTEDNEMS